MKRTKEESSCRVGMRTTYLTGERRQWRTERTGKGITLMRGPSAGREREQYRRPFEMQDSRHARRGREKRSSTRDPITNETNERGKRLSRGGSADRRRVSFRRPIRCEYGNYGGKDGTRPGSVIDPSEEKRRGVTVRGVRRGPQTDAYEDARG